MTPASGFVAYFCMEFGLHESFPIYAGGLGVLAGDFIKAARDLSAPLVAVGLRWERGYGAQRIGPDGQSLRGVPFLRGPLPPRHRGADPGAGAGRRGAVQRLGDRALRHTCRSI